KALDDFDEIVDPPIVNAVFPCREERKQALEAEDVPRIDDGPAGNAAVQQILNLWKQASCFHQLAALYVPLGINQANADFTLHSYRSDRNPCCLSPTRLRVAHLSEKQRQLSLLQLQGALPSQIAIEMLPGAAERLPRQVGFLPQPVAVRSRGCFEQ